MDPVQLDFWLAGTPLALAALSSLVIIFRGQRLAGLLLLLAFSFLLAHMTLTTFYSESVFTMEQVMTPYGEMEMNLTAQDWYMVFLYLKSAAYCGIPLALWLLARPRQAGDA